MRKIFICLSLLALLPLMAWGQQIGDFTVTGDVANYSFSDNKLTVTGGEVTVSTTQQTSQTIQLTGGKLILNGVNINTDQAPPIEVKGEAEIQVAAGSTNTLTSNNIDYAAIHVPEESSVTFTGGGALEAKNTINDYSSYSSCGIGGQQGTFSCGSITFEMTGGGSVTATRGPRSAGIGTCSSRDIPVSGSIRIKSGTIKATMGVYAAGIGAGPDGGADPDKKVSILIEGGTITATENHYALGIGNGFNSKASLSVVITGGTVTGSVGKGGGPMTINLEQVIVGPDATVTGGVTNYDNGFVFKDGQAEVKGNAVFPEKASLTIDAGETLTIPAGAVLINNGSIINNGTITGDGMIVGNQPTGSGSNNTAKGFAVTCCPNYEGASESTVVYVKENGNIPTDVFSNPYYTFVGWYDAQSDGNEIKTITQTTTAYAYWTPNSFTTKEGGITFSDLVYGIAFEHTFTADELSEDITEKSGGLASIAVKTEETNALPEGLTFEDLTLSGTPTTPSNVTTILTLTANNGATAEITLTFTVSKATPTITLTVPTDEDLVYDGEAKTATVTVKGVDGETETLTAKIAYYTDEEMTMEAENVVNAGTYYVKATFAGNRIYNAATETANFTISKATPTVTKWTTESPYIYTGKAITLTAPKVTGINEEEVTYTNVTFTYKQGGTDVEAAIKPGEYTATATYTGNNNYADTSAEVTFVIQSPDNITATSDALTEANSNGWTRLANGQKYPVTLTAPTNYTFTEEAMATISGDGAHIYTLKRSTGNQETTVSHTLYLDATAPTATLGTPSSTTVVLTLADATSGIASCTIKEGETELYTYLESTAETRSGETEAGATTGKHSLSYTYTGKAGTSHTLTVSLTDMAGNTTTQDISVTFTKYTITLLQSEHGSISADKTEAADGETVTLSYREDSHYDFAGWSVTTDDGTEVSVSGNSFVMPAANVTVTASFHYDPPYVPSYYDIYFDGDENDSVRYECNTTTIREGGTFSFTIEVAEGYAPETLVVEYKRGRAGSWKTVEPNSRGQYRITSVYHDIYVRSRIEPISDPTGIEQVGNGKSSIRCDGKRIRISTTEPQTMHIINVGGRLVRTAQLPAGDTEVNDLSQGFYIVLLSDGTRAKTLIN